MTIYGRTVGKYCKFQISDNSSTMRDIPVNSFGSVGLSYAETDVSALQEALTSVLAGQGSFSTTISGPFDNSTAVTASASTERPALTGSHTVLEPLNGGQVAKSFGIYFGIRADWIAGDPVFGGIKSVLVSNYTVNPDTMTYSATISTAGNRNNDPAWGTAAITATS